MTSEQQVWAHRPSVIQVGDASRVVLLDLDDAAHPPRILTGPAASVWMGVDGSRDVPGICRHVAEEFGLTADEVSTDVRTFLADLAAGGLLHETDTPRRGA